MRPSILLSFFSTAVVALNIDSKYKGDKGKDDCRRGLEARAFTTLYTTSTVYSTSTSKTTSCLISLGKSCLISTTKTVTKTAPVKTTVIPYTTKSVADPTSTVKSTSTSSVKTSSTSTSTSTKTSTTSTVKTTTSIVTSVPSSSTSSKTSSQSTSSAKTTTSSAATSSVASTAQAVPTCGFVGYDNGTSLGYYTDASSVTYAGCNALCTSNTACLSFAYATSGTPACLLYSYVIEGHDVAYAASPYTFFNRGGVCAVTSSSTTSSIASTTTTTPIPEPTCGLVGWEVTGTNIGFYTAITTYSACNDLCNGNVNCLSLGYGAASNGTCILYNHVVEGNVTADSTSPWTYFDRGSVCPKASTTSSTATSSTASAAPSYTAGVQYCPTGYTTYNTTAPVTGYQGCNSTYTYSTCATGAEGNALCNLCGSCLNDTPCTSTSQCQTTYGAGYACVSGSACATGGSPVCLYMLAGGEAHGCYGANSN